MFSKTLLLACVAFCFVNYCYAKLELILAVIQEPTSETMDVDQAGKAFAYGKYLADKYRKEFGINNGYKEEDLDYTAQSSKNSKQTALLFKQGVLSKKYRRLQNYDQDVYGTIPALREMDLWTLTQSSEEDLAKVPELDNKFLLYQRDCPALWEEIEKDERYCLVDIIDQLKQSSKQPSLDRHVGHDILYSMLNDMDFDLKMKRLSGGLLLNEIMTAFNSLTKSYDLHQKILLYVLPPELMSFLVLSFSPPGTRFNETEIDHQISPKYGSIFVTELRSNDTKDDDWTIKLLYRNEDKDVLQPMKLPDCGIKCPVREAYEKLQPYMIIEDDLRKECKTQNRTI